MPCGRRTLRDGELTLRLAATNLDQETAGFIVGYECLSRSRARALEPESRGVPRCDEPALRGAVPRRIGQRDLRVYLRRSRMDFLQHFLLGQPVEDNGQDSARRLLSTHAAARRRRPGARRRRGACATASCCSSRTARRPTGTPAANAIRPAGRHYDYDVDSRRARRLRGVAPAARARAWSLEAGAPRSNASRYDYDNRMIDGNTDENGVPCPGGCLYSRPADRRDDFTNVAPRLGLVWQPGDGRRGLCSRSRAASVRRRRPSSTGCSASSRSPTSTRSEPTPWRLGLRWRVAARRARPRALSHGQART